MNYQKLDPKAKMSWRLARIIRLIVVALIFIPAWIFFVLFLSMPAIGATIMTIVFALILAYMTLALIIYPEIEYRQWAYLITDDRVEIKEGIFFISTTVIPILRIQHVTYSQGPINRKYGLAEVTINTASKEFLIKGLSSETAEQITTLLKDRLYSRIDSQEGHQ